MSDDAFRLDLVRLVDRRPGLGQLAGAAALAPLLQRTALGAAAQETASGIASPLTETAFADRRFFADRELTSSDGLFTLLVNDPARVKFQDANGREVVLKFLAKPVDAVKDTVVESGQTYVVWTDPPP